MKLDLLVYGRGQERLDGYQLFAAPNYWRDEMLIAMGTFNDLWTQGDLSDTENEAFAVELNPWGKTYIFVYMNEPYCCAFLRCTRVEGDTEGTWLKEARNFDIWSMEGVCCPFEQKERFFAMLPSVILWFEQDNTSLYRRLKDGKIGQTVDIPENLMYNPYTFLNNPPSNDLYSLFVNNIAKKRFNDLCKLMNYSTQPFYFLFGPLARNFASRIGTTYGINCVFSTIDDNAVNINEPDPFSKMETILQRASAKNRISCSLNLNIASSRNGISRQWKIESKENTVLEGDIVPLKNNDSINVIQLRAEADAIRNFAIKMQWGLGNNSLSEKYKFEMEEQ